jgi:hypothetical protein
MCEKCDELQLAVEHKQRAAERAQALMDGFQPAPQASAEVSRRNAERVAAENALADLQAARERLALHKAEHRSASKPTR